MKKTILIALVMANSLWLMAQKDSTKVDVNTVPLISINDVQQFDNKVLSELPAKYTDAIRHYFNQLIATRLKESQSRKKN